jgi:ABC-2 type transport system permease protein
MSDSPHPKPQAASPKPAAVPFRPHYWRVWSTFARNSLVREMSFRGNFITEVITRAFWFCAQLVLFDVIYRQVDLIDDWTRPQYFAFMATGMLINACVEALFMPNCAELSELIRTGNLDFLLLKPIDTQFLVSFRVIDWAMINQILMASVLLGYALDRVDAVVTPAHAAMYVLLLASGVAFFYSLMIILASTSVWFGRNQGLYDFWFYVTVFARYPQNIYARPGVGEIIWFGFSFIIPILLVVTVPARVLLGMALDPGSWIALLAPLMTLVMLFVSRRVFNWSLNHYRSASS